MGKPVKTYDLTKVFLIVGGYRIGGFGESGGIEIEWSSGVAEPTVGADGEAAISRTNDNSAKVTITVMETSKSYRDLAELYQAQKGQDAVQRLEFLCEDTISGDKVTDQFAVFTAMPGISKARKVGERKFELFLPNALENAVFGGNIAV